MRLLTTLAWSVLALSACDKKKEAVPSTAPASGSAAAGSAAIAAPAPEAPAAKPPTITTEMLFAEAPTWSVEAVPRGLWHRSGKGAIEHKCRQEFAMFWVQNSMLRSKAKDIAGATTCGPKGAFTVCTFTNPAKTDADADKLVSWVFVGPDASPIMVAVLHGPLDDFDAIAPELAKVQGCPRPSDDPDMK
jgi:hypothetical protein